MRTFIILTVLLSFLYSNAQLQKDVEDHQITINALLPGVVYELGVSKSSTLTAEATMGFAYQESDFFGDGFGIITTLIVEYERESEFLAIQVTIPPQP